MAHKNTTFFSTLENILVPLLKKGLFLLLCPHASSSSVVFYLDLRQNHGSLIFPLGGLFFWQVFLPENHEGRKSFHFLFSAGLVLFAYHLIIHSSLLDGMH